MSRKAAAGVGQLGLFNLEPQQEKRPRREKKTEPATKPSTGPRGEKLTIDEAFARFHGRHREVADYLFERMKDCRRDGVEHFGIGCIWELCRWNYRLEKDEGEPYRFNNNFRALYSRLLMTEHPEFSNFFETRKRRAKGAKTE
jgi:hypothetical protein